MFQIMVTAWIDLHTGCLFIKELYFVSKAISQVYKLNTKFSSESKSKAEPSKKRGS